MEKRLAIIITHPIQYYAPWFRMLSDRKQCRLKVFYTWSQSETSVTDRTFGKEIKWDIPLLEGYDYEFVENVSKNPGSHHFFGIDCPALISKIEAYQPDAILFFGWKFKSYLSAIRHFKGKVPIWFRGDSTLLDEKGGYRSLLRRMVLKKVYGYVDRAFYVGQANKAYFLKHGLKPSQLVYAPHAIDNDRFMGECMSCEQSASEWRRKLGYSNEDTVVLFAGKFEAKKQPDILVAAIIAANDIRKKPLKLLLVGNGPLEAQLHKMADGNPHIQFLPFQNQTQMPLVYRLGDLLCLPSKGPGETWGLAVNEAMACERPVIVSSKVGCAEDLVIGTDNGYVFPHDNVEALIKILADLNYENLKVSGKQAKVYIQKYNFGAIANAIENQLSKL